MGKIRIIGKMKSIGPNQSNPSEAESPMTVRENFGIPVRLTAPRAHNTLGHVRRISVPRLCVALCVGAACSSAAVAADQDAWTIRILPATKMTLAQATPPSHPALPSQPAPPPYEPGTKSAPQANPPAAA